ncbi:hypothetical protein [Paludisphaera rhizosphaerae]|uniref:hypothetical protein n=1 Tax=Paludisphaera rhizosphaerae TaxID=2711216 RepID=UPI0013EB6548|nr:hypothetical protein [Paludisphaera rhizosphaerae]
MTAPCPALKPLADGADMGGLLRFATDLVDDYHECAARHRALAGWSSRYDAE